MRAWATRAFHDSLETLAQIGLRESGALGYGFFERSRTSGALILLDGDGAVIPQVAPHTRTPALVEYPLRTKEAVNASIAFAFGTEVEAARSRPRLDGIAATVQTIWAAATAEERYAKLIDRVENLEAQLMDSKISERARGFLANRVDTDAAAVIAMHVDGVLRPTQTRRMLEQVLSELEQEVEERQLAAQAKHILQTLHGISEEQAHAQLRLASRKSRRRLRDVAQQVIREQHPLKGRIA
jgi:AmiR/NasT family two-component response regulator